MNQTQNKWSDQEIDNLIESVEATLEKATQLSKSAPLKKDDQPPQADPQAEAAPQDAAAAPASAQDAAAAPASADPADADDQAASADPAQAAAGDDQALAQDENAPLSDEELAQIYGSMAPDELERHYSIIRQQLQSAYSQDQSQQADPAAQAQAPDQQQAAPAPAQQEQMPPEMQKSEHVMALERQVAEQGQALEQITKAFEALAKPQRKSVTDLQFIAKTEHDAPNGGSGKQLSAAELKEAAKKLAPQSLTKSERDLINGFYLRGEGQDEVQKLINSKGGK